MDLDNNNFSDSEATFRLKKGAFYDSLGIRGRPREDEYMALDPNSSSADEFGVGQNLTSKSLKSGRQRKRQAARSKGGEFQSKRKKRRLYFCCVGSEIDIQKLHDYLLGSGGLFNGWKFRLHDNVLHLYKSGILEEAAVQSYRVDEFGRDPFLTNLVSGNGIELGSVGVARTRSVDSNLPAIGSSPFEDYASWRISASKAQEVFVFDFGAVVFWGFSLGEETNLLKTIRIFVTRGMVDNKEFKEGEDDMGFLTSPEEELISLANDVITLREDTPPKQRLSISFAIAQSTVLAIFESRVQKKIEAYKYIPEALAASGKVQLTEREIGIMIGEVFVIRHDVNLHTEILDTPDFFWKQEKFEADYKLVSVEYFNFKL